MNFAEFDGRWFDRRPVQTDGITAHDADRDHPMASSYACGWMSLLEIGLMFAREREAADTGPVDKEQTLGGLLRMWRERALLTQEQLARHSRLNVRTVRRLELDEVHRPRNASLYALARSLGLNDAEEEKLIAAARNAPARALNLPIMGKSAISSRVAAADDDLRLRLITTPQQLPPNAAHFVGRRTELAVLDDLFKEPEPATEPNLQVLVIVGGAGIGKTTLALKWCSSVADEFPDGQLYVNLRGFGTLTPIEPVSALAMLLRSLGVAPDEIPDDPVAASALFRTRTANKRLLLLLDNALDSEQVRPLLPAPGCTVVVTSRDQLRSLAARDATARISLPPLELRDSVELLSRVSGRTTVPFDDPTVRELTDLCDNSPLALRIIGERLARRPDIRLSDIVDEITHERLEVFYSGDDAPSDMRTVLSWSYQHLDRDAAWMLRAVGALYPGSDFSLAAAGALSGFSLRKAHRHLDRLVSTHLVQQQSHDRYNLHDLVRAYAAEESRRHDATSVRTNAISRLLTWFIHGMYAADVIFTPGRMREPLGELSELSEIMEPFSFSDPFAARRWCELEHQTLIALPAWAYDNGEPLAACQIAFLQEVYLFHYSYHHELLSGHKIAVKAAQEIGNLRLEGHLLSAMGNAYSELLRLNEAAEYFYQALAAVRGCKDRRGEAKVLGNIAMNAIDTQDYETARKRCEQALAAVVDSGYERGHAHTLDTLGEAHFGLGAIASAIECWHQALVINRRSGALFVQATNITNLGRAYSALGDHENAIKHHLEAISVCRAIENPRGEAMAIFNLGRAYLSQGRLTDAEAAWQESLAIFSKVRDAKADDVWREIQTLRKDRR
ncbi:ATP-binding protein [Nonomuraea diastatica]|uniref:XRE family transcriptional regulator n=1 Tax=Nonomuraea diastatica TaxID=1848329 RepID=A0A4R4VND2_9ACTN|nr:XRE family transcriptional regulator [Nonomuraea diastatica]TDD01560.1 XRE family transcriptional regulator [Nonomuraea diastatica]